MATLTSEQCKSHAAQCGRLAETAASREQKTILLDLAREWAQTGKQVERLEIPEANAGR